MSLSPSSTLLLPLSDLRLSLHLNLHSFCPAHLQGIQKQRELREWLSSCYIPTAGNRIISKACNCNAPWQLLVRTPSKPKQPQPRIIVQFIYLSANCAVYPPPSRLPPSTMLRIRCTHCQKKYKISTYCHMPMEYLASWSGGGVRGPDRGGVDVEATQSTNVFGYCGQWEIALNNEFHLNKYLKRCQQTRPQNRKHN